MNSSMRSTKEGESLSGMNISAGIDKVPTNNLDDVAVVGYDPVVNNVSNFSEENPNEGEADLEVKIESNIESQPEEVHEEETVEQEEGAEGEELEAKPEEKSEADEKKSRAQERIRALNTRTKEAEKSAAEKQKLLDDAQKEIEQLRQKLMQDEARKKEFAEAQKAVQSTAPQIPNEADYFDADGNFNLRGYIEAREKFLVAQTQEQIQATLAHERQRNETEKIIRAHEDREKQFVSALDEPGKQAYSTMANGVAMVLQSNAVYGPHVTRYIAESAYSPELIARLGSDLEGFHAVMSSNNPARVFSILGRIEGEIDAMVRSEMAKSGEKPAKKPVQQAKMPVQTQNMRKEPPPPIPGIPQGGRTPDPADLNRIAETGSIRDYEKARGYDRRGW